MTGYISFYNNFIYENTLPSLKTPYCQTDTILALSTNVLPHVHTYFIPEFLSMFQQTTIQADDNGDNYSSPMSYNKILAVTEIQTVQSSDINVLSTSLCKECI